MNVHSAVAAPVVITTGALGNRARAAASERITTALIGSGGIGFDAAAFLEIESEEKRAVPQVQF